MQLEQLSFRFAINVYNLLIVSSTFSPSRCLQEQRGSEGREESQVRPVLQDPPAFQARPQEMWREGSQAPAAHKDHVELQVHLGYLGKMESL